jgi:iron(III) transport system permease protein
MSSARLGFAVLLLLALALPALVPARFVVSASAPKSTALDDPVRPLSLVANTAGLSAVAVGVAVSFGTALALFAVRGPVWGRRGIRAAILTALFVPLPVYAVAWQAVLAGWLPPLALEPGAVAWRAWNTGLLPAGFVHGMAGVPWVAWIVGEILSRTDRDLEDDANVSGGSWAVVQRVVLPRATTATLVAAAWVCVQTTTEIPITDAMMVRTFAEEVYTRLVSSGEGIAAAVAITIPVWLAGVAVGLFVGRRVEVSPTVSEPNTLRFPRWMTPAATVFAWIVVGLFAVLPLLALVLKAATGGLFAQVRTVIEANRLVLLTSLLWSAVTGVGVAMLARWACWQAVRSRAFGRFLVVLCVVLFLTPGPLVGLGLKDVIRWLVDLEAWALNAVGVRLSFPPLSSLLYDQPSPVPVVWAAAVRLFPVACVVLWPSVRAIPRELWEAVALDGHGFRGEWRLVAGPFTRGAYVRAAVAVAALSLGEVSAGKLVTPPGYETFILRLFAQMHYGAESTVAALCLVQIAASAAFAALLRWISSAR